MAALHDHVLGKPSHLSELCAKLQLSGIFTDLLFFPSSAAPANLADAEGSSSRLERVLRVGEIISAIAAAAKLFAAKFFPGNSDSVDLDQTASMLTQATEEHDNVLRSVHAEASRLL